MSYPTPLLPSATFMFYDAFLLYFSQLVLLSVCRTGLYLVSSIYVCFRLPFFFYSWNISHFYKQKVWQFRRHPTALQFFILRLFTLLNKNSSTMPTINIYIPVSTNISRNSCWDSRRAHASYKISIVWGIFLSLKIKRHGTNKFI